MSDDKSVNTELVNASIDQKFNELRPVPFSSAIDLSGNKKYLKYALPPLLVLIIILVSAPSIITEPTSRLVKHNEHFEKALPFQILITNDKLEVIQNEDPYTVTGVINDPPENISFRFSFIASILSDVDYADEMCSIKKFDSNSSRHEFKAIYRDLTSAQGYAILNLHQAKQEQFAACVSASEVLFLPSR